ncbi:hypothetical protein ATEIFO6365_0001024000 [Aspergillus terreus]|uniref:Uncharacterized protein n=1 Tax=Aspergillus terreus TaxID=33178 RepID=A0A5M3Z316_ASPTE|nr:hypothetical protein ATETN484_0006039300 [Aspergillus terreus]GFF12017.1 hypothetical protein ATEIFO6365_0001024000 [Aspergillus terreus]
MLFNLGLTADAAAAHQSDSVGGLPPESQLSPPSRHSTPPVLSFASLASFYNRHKAVESDIRHKEPQPAMSINPGELGDSSDGEHSVAGPVLARSPIARAQSVRKQSSRPKTCYQLAHPAGHARHKRLKLRPKLLLQLQRVSQTPRALPVLDVLPSTVFLPRLARKFPTIFRGKKGLGPNDLIIVTSDLYERHGGDIAHHFLHSDEDHGEHREVVATICQLLKEDALAKGKAEICLNHGPVWEATPLPNGSYEFVANTEQGPQVLRWVQRGAKNRRVSAPPGSPVQEDTKRFTFSVINPNTRRHPVIATMTRNYLEVFDEYSMPTTPTSVPPTSSTVSVISDGSEMEAPSANRKTHTTDDNLRTLIIITSIWVAFREGWSYNFRYDDHALAINSKALCAPIGSRHLSPTTPRLENDLDPVGEESQPTRRPLGVSNTMPWNGTMPDRVHAYGSLTKRSNSTGAAFIERSNRRSSGAGSRPSRHSMLPLAPERRASPVSTVGTRDFGTSPQNGTRRGTNDTNITRSHSVSVQAADRSLSNNHDTSRQLHEHHKKTGEMSGRNIESEPVKTKRRHRFSGWFDFMTKRRESLKPGA